MMTALSSGAAVLLLILCFIVFSWASFRHFAPGSRSMGNLLVRVLTFAGTGLSLMLVWLAPPASALTGICAIGLALTALWIFFAALRSAPVGSLHVAFTGGGPQALVTTGIYGRIRNPFYTSYLAYWAGWMTATSLHPASVACFALFLVVYWIAVRDEEAFLTRQFGDQYVAFKLSTGRFLPRLSALRP